VIIAGRAARRILAGVIAAHTTLSSDWRAIRRLIAEWFLLGHRADAAGIRLRQLRSESPAQPT